MRMSRRLGENILDDAFCQFAGALILFQNDQHGHAGFNVRASLSVDWVHVLLHFIKVGHVSNVTYQALIMVLELL